jgi:protein-S-isoprenylcysteine O-methyltransferase Ste14
LTSVARHVVAILLLPGLATILVPATVLRNQDPAAGWYPSAPGRGVGAALGLACISVGLLLMARTIALFASFGRGTLAPWDPPRRLVVRGIYRHVRNPMISGVFAILLGEALLFGSSALLGWFFLFVMVNLLYIPLIEEPMLLRRFGDDYVVYRGSVRRWVPRLRPWEPPWDRPPGRAGVAT